MTRQRRIHIFGASGSGTTTLGAALAEACEIDHLDTDDFYWKPTDPPFVTKHLPEDRISAIRTRVAGRNGWVLSGSIVSWGAPLIPLFELAVFLHLDPALRMTRLRAREQARYGDRIGPGGDLAVSSREFLAWAESYDAAAPPIRSRRMHDAWMAELPCPVLQLDSEQSTACLVEATLGALDALDSDPA